MTALVLPPWRARALSLIEAWQGLSADPDGGTADRYGAVLAAPGDSEAIRAAELVMSSCELLALALLRVLGVEDAILALAYVSGTAGSRLKAVADHKGAWRPGTTVPQPGDVVVVGGSEALGGLEHAFIIETVDVDPDGTLRIGSVDGGQRDAKHYECFARCERRILDGWDHEDGGAHSVRKVMGVVDLDRLFV